jgi:hypothetical protein
MPLGNSRDQHSWLEWKGSRTVCRRLIFDGAGLFCGNFSSRRGVWTECHQVWCGKCYKPLDNNEFPIARPRDEEGNEVLAEEDRERFIVARNGDNLVTPFQCDLCHFRNLVGRDPVSNLPQDV